MDTKRVSVQRLRSFLCLAARKYGFGTRSEPVPLYMDDMLNAGRRVYDKQSPPVQDGRFEI
ncbi:hypothetical protein NECAME_05529 [Necator americanus]|uniref:Uncharacterized protein n=1 Tax=Necator americanus TaxID=51031 RepID=W2SGD2_NECAM|nr:hypothetical protein NECAME_05529 [Necator americanus]ETN68684.1 hypothetical protein NECAME_05529 [Necator americanus]